MFRIDLLNLADITTGIVELPVVALVVEDFIGKDRPCPLKTFSASRSGETVGYN